MGHVFVWHWVQQHRVLSVVILALFMVASAGGTAWALVFRTVSSPVSLADALRIYRREQAAKVLTSLRDHLPTPGVYSYRTTGSEGLSFVGSGRSFPSRTAMVVTDGTCAAVSWVPLEQHMEETTLCAGPHGAYTVPRLVTHETIAGTTSTQTVDCPATAYVLPPGAQPGLRWSATCTLESPPEKVGLVGAVLGPAVIDVGGRPVAVEHTRFDLTFDGAQRGTNPTDLWLVPGAGLIVRERELVAVTTAGVRYSEAMGATLTSLRPAR